MKEYEVTLEYKVKVVKHMMSSPSLLDDDVENLMLGTEEDLDSVSGIYSIDLTAIDVEETV